MGSRKATMLLVVSLVLLVLLAGGCSAGEPATGGEEDDFQEGTLSSNRSTEATGIRQADGGERTSGPARNALLRIAGGEDIRFSGICTVGEREYVVSGAPSKTYSFDRPFSCTIEKQDSGGGDMQVTVVSGDSTRSVQQTNAQGGTIDVSYGVS